MCNNLLAKPCPRCGRKIAKYVFKIWFEDMKLVELPENRAFMKSDEPWAYEIKMTPSPTE
jgi:hypothetical protein